MQLSCSSVYQTIIITKNQIWPKRGTKLIIINIDFKLFTDHDPNVSKGSVIRIYFFLNLLKKDNFY